MSGLTLIPAENATVEMNDGDGWVEFPGIANFAETAGEAGTTEVQTFKGARQTAGSPPPSGISFDVAAHVPHHSSWARAAIARAAKKQVRIKITTEAILLWDGVSDEHKLKYNPARVGAATPAQPDYVHIGKDYSTPIDDDSVADVDTYPDLRSDDYGVGDAVIWNAGDLAAANRKMFVLDNLKAVSGASGAIVTQPPTIKPPVAGAMFNPPGDGTDQDDLNAIYKPFRVITPGLELVVACRILSLPSLGSLATGSALTAAMTVSCKSIPDKPSVTDLGLYADVGVY